MAEKEIVGHDRTDLCAQSIREDQVVERRTLSSLFANTRVTWESAITVVILSWQRCNQNSSRCLPVFMTLLLESNPLLVQCVRKISRLASKDVRSSCPHRHRESTQYERLTSIHVRASHVAWQIGNTLYRRVTRNSEEATNRMVFFWRWFCFLELKGHISCQSNREASPSFQSVLSIFTGQNEISAEDT